MSTFLVNNIVGSSKFAVDVDHFGSHPKSGYQREKDSSLVSDLKPRFCKKKV